MKLLSSGLGFFPTLFVFLFVLMVVPVLGFERVGVVVDTMESGQYTYVEVETPGGRYWAATPKINVSAGDRVDVTPGSEMKNFFSPTLNRTFEVIIFTPSVKVVGKGGDETKGSPAPPQEVF
ncbi:MAG TPA: hypothetical protein VLB09_03365 [Nitrospiria bacterium]|nr:hypothetical protein [Nitrospiria bacterium]